jgi:hypothetical protein
MSNTKLLVILQFFKSFFTDSFHIKFSLSLSLFPLPVRLITPLRTSVIGDLHWICPNHLERCYINFSSTDPTPNVSCMSSFRIRSLLVLSQIHHNMCISATISCKNWAHMNQSNVMCFVSER